MMSEHKLRSLKILGRLQAVIGAGIAVVIFALFGIKPSLLSDAGASLTAAILGATGAIYFLTLHQLLSRTRLALSTLILTVVTALNFIIVIASTGGLDSPFYSLWLLAIVVAGIFGTRETVAVLGFTIIYYLYELIREGLNAPFVQDHFVQLGITIAAAGLAEWVHSRNRRATIATSKIEKLSGQLSAEQLKAEAIMSSINEGVIVVDNTRKIQLFNRAAGELTGWESSSAEGIDYNLVLQLKTADDQNLNELTDPFVEAWKKGESVVRDNFVMTTRAGRKTQINISVSPIYDADQQPSGAIALFRDISREKEVERQKDEFISTASHEMRTPVAAIEGYISLAMNPNVATIDDRAKKYLEKAHDTIAHLGELFRDLLNVTKAEEGNLGGKIEPINIAQLVQGAADDMQFTVQKKGLTLVYQIGGQNGKAISPLYFVAVNPERLREVVMNLIENAVKFTLEGGIKITLDGNEKEVMVSISDTGIGIAREDIPHLFQKFYRIDNSATRTIGGTGLGLYLCRQLIEHFNGRIWVESKPNEGSTFRFSLPRLSEADAIRMQEEAATTASQQQIISSGQSIGMRPAQQPVAQPIPTQQPTGVSGPAITPMNPPTMPVPAAQNITHSASHKVQ